MHKSPENMLPFMMLNLKSGSRTIRRDLKFFKNFDPPPKEYHSRLEFNFFDNVVRPRRVIYNRKNKFHILIDTRLVEDQNYRKIQNHGESSHYLKSTLSI